MLAPERPSVADLYFVGMAGWSLQDVFIRETRAAREIFDERFDTRGRSVLLSNDAKTYGELPLGTSTNLAQVLKAVGARMNRDESVLFLFATSHGSERGLALHMPYAARGLSEHELAPKQLRAMLDDAGIKWRVLVVSGCRSGVFVDELKDDSTLIATAAASDRNSFGCGTGFAFTDFGRAVFDEQFRRSHSFVAAFTQAAGTIAERESKARRKSSLPQLYVGPAIAQKLTEIEDRLDNH